jgi:hypothetical protein
MGFLPMGDREGRFALVPWMVMERLNAQEMGLYCALAVHADKSGWCWPSRETLAAICQKSEPWVSATLKTLADRHVIEIAHTGTGRTSSKYRLPISCSLNPPELRKTGYYGDQPTEVRGQENEFRGQPIDPNNTKEHITPLVISRDMTVPVMKTAEGWVNFKTDFETMWNHYPRKVGKGAARKAFQRVVRTVTASEFVNAYFKALERWERDKTELQYIPHLATWLNQERWSDDS